MKIEMVSRNPDLLRLTLAGEEIRFLRLALQRATFLDTPPMDQKDIYDFSDELLRRLERLSDFSHPS